MHTVSIIRLIITKVQSKKLYYKLKWTYHFASGTKKNENTVQNSRTEIKRTRIHEHKSGHSQHTSYYRLGTWSADMKSYSLWKQGGH